MCLETVPGGWIDYIPLHYKIIQILILSIVFSHQKQNIWNLLSLEPKGIEDFKS